MAIKVNHCCTSLLYVLGYINEFSQNTTIKRFATVLFVIFVAQYSKDSNTISHVGVSFLLVSYPIPSSVSLADAKSTDKSAIFH